MRLLFVAFILVPLIEIGVFIQLGGALGLPATLLMVVITAIIGVQLLRHQGLNVWQEIQLQLAQGRVPAIQMLAAAQLLFAGGLLLTPGFFTDFIGFALMVPTIRLSLARHMMNRWPTNISSAVPPGAEQHANSVNSYDARHFKGDFPSAANQPDRANPKSRESQLVEGEFEDQTK